MTYDDAIDWLLSYADFERSGAFLDRPDVAPVKHLLRALGDPQEGRLTVHVAGSKGKGSISAMIDSILRAAGVATGLYTSPHLHDYTERIRVDGEPISQAGFAALTGVLREAVESLDIGERRLVTFDLLTALGFLAFRDAHLDAQVVEVGLGGRVDSSNVFDEKAVAVITPLSFEHTAVLGDEIVQIAAEKAAIVIRGCTAVLAPQPFAAAAGVVHERAAQVGAGLVDVANDYRWQIGAHDIHGQDVRIERPEGALDVRLPLIGVHQAENAATAVAAVDALSASATVGDDATVRGLAAVRWPGRLEVLRESPLIVADGAHNADSARRLADALRDYCGASQVTFVIGSSSDKDVRGLAEALAPLATGGVIAARSAHPRAMEPSQIAGVFHILGVNAEYVDSVATAVDRAMAASGSDGVICLAGSLFVAAEGRAYLGQSRGGRGR
jgi:dihydrofolate synthase/folylpolyglutamate synthase